jgi:hypothetical protein
LIRGSAAVVDSIRNFPMTPVFSLFRDLQPPSYMTSNLAFSARYPRISPLNSLHSRLFGGARPFGRCHVHVLIRGVSAGAPNVKQWHNPTPLLEKAPLDGFRLGRQNARAFDGEGVADFAGDVIDLA